MNVLTLAVLALVYMGGISFFGSPRGGDPGGTASDYIKAAAWPVLFGWNGIWVIARLVTRLHDRFTERSTALR